MVAIGIIGCVLVIAGLSSAESVNGWNSPWLNPVSGSGNSGATLSDSLSTPTTSTTDAEFSGVMQLYSFAEDQSPSSAQYVSTEGVHGSTFTAWKTGTASYTFTSTYNLASVFYQLEVIESLDGCSPNSAAMHILIYEALWDNTLDATVLANTYYTAVSATTNGTLCSSGGSQTVSGFGPSSVSVTATVSLANGHAIIPRAGFEVEIYTNTPYPTWLNYGAYASSDVAFNGANGLSGPALLTGMTVT